MYMLVGFYKLEFSPAPGQPVVDLENYMNALEKKMQYVQKCVEKLHGHEDDRCQKYCPHTHVKGVLWIYLCIMFYFGVFCTIM